MKKVFINPGHGGLDIGAEANGLREKDLVLTISKKIVNYLKDYNVTVKMFRSNDTFYSLDRICQEANKWGADFFLSVHINAGGGTGYEDYIYTGLSNASSTAKLRDTIHTEITNSLGNSVRNRGKKKANLAVLRGTNMPAMLTENLFIDNKTDAARLKDDKFLNKIAKGHANGIIKALGLKKKTNTSNKYKSVKIQTGGLSNTMLIEAVNYMRRRGWWGQVTLNKKGNPTLLTGGLNPTMRKEFETWLKQKKWWFKVIE